MHDPVRNAQIEDAFQGLLELLCQGAEEDARHGPRWRGLSVDELMAHLMAHAEEVDEDASRRDPDTGVLTLYHVALRALMVAQAIEDGRR